MSLLGRVVELEAMIKKIKVRCSSENVAWDEEGIASDVNFILEGKDKGCI